MKLLPQILTCALLASLGSAWSSSAAGTNAPVTRKLQQKKSDLLAGEVKGICYSGFRTGQHPDRGEGAANPTDEQILEDLNILGRHGEFPLIRLYDAKTNSAVVLQLIQKHRLKFKVMLGAWLAGEMNNPGCSWLKPMSPETLQANRRGNEAEVREAIRLANQYSNIVVSVAVGNEALVSWNDHMVTLESVIHYVREVKRSVRQPVTVCDNYDWWAKHGKELARELDFVSIHTYPLWENQDVDQAMPFTISNLQAVRDALPDARLVITEAGWATTASEFGGRADEARQKKYYQDIYAWAAKVNITTFFFEAFDEDWKGDSNPLGAEKHWGIFTVDRKPKLVMQEKYPDLKK
jgi:exo-beta-1,3-glucanase (GH17 family)